MQLQFFFLPELILHKYSVEVYFFIRTESAPNVHAISEESITCVAVKEDRHVALKKRGLKRPGELREWQDSSTYLVVVNSR